MTPAKSIHIAAPNLPPSERDEIIRRLDGQLVYMVCACYFDGTPDCLYGPFTMEAAIDRKSDLLDENPSRPMKLFVLLSLDEIA